MVLFLVDLSAEETESFSDSCAVLRVVLTDAARKDYGVDPAHGSGKAADIFGQLMAKHGLHKFRTFVAFFGSRFNRAVVSGARNAEHTGLLVHKLVDFISGQVGILFHKEGNDSRIDGTAARTHNNAFQGCDAHRGVKAFSVLNSGNGRAVSEMAGHDLRAFGFTAEQLDAAFGNKTVRSAVETVTADVVFFVKLIGERVHISVIGHSCMETGIKNGNLRDAGHDLLTRFNTHQIGGIVERAEIKALTDSLLDLVIYKNRTIELLSAVQHAMADGADFFHGRDDPAVRADKRIENQTDRFAVVFHFSVFTFAALLRSAGNGMGELTVFKSNLFTNTLGKKRFGLHVDELILERRTPTVDHKNFHIEPPIRIYLKNPKISFIIYRNVKFFKTLLKEVDRMRTIAFIIAEYDPFHNGHLRHLRATKEAGAKHIVVILSGNFVQRGDIAMCSKHMRTEMALSCGADLVLENPVKYVLSGAGRFAEGAIRTIKNSGLTGTLSFGASTSVMNLNKTANLISAPDFQSKIAEYSAESRVPFPYAVQAIVRETDKELSEVLKDPNNVLAMEYILSAKRFGLDCDCFAVERNAAQHNDVKTFGRYASGKTVREFLYAGDPIWQTFCPEKTIEILKTGMNAGALVDKKKWSDLAYGRLLDLSRESLSGINGVTEGFENRLYKGILASTDLYALADLVKTKRFTHARIRQALISAVLGIKKADLEREQPYIRVLGANEEGRKLLREIRNRSAVPVVMNLSEAPLCPERDLDALSGKLYDLSRPAPFGGRTEYEQRPVIIPATGR